MQSILCDQSRSLFERYRAMFALRNRGDKAAVDVRRTVLVSCVHILFPFGALQALAEGFKEPHSALLRHEIAYVMGAWPALAACSANRPFLPAV